MTVEEVLDSCGHYLVTNPEQDELAERACKEGLIRPVQDFYPEMKSKFYVRSSVKTKYELPCGVNWDMLCGVKPPIKEGQLCYLYVAPDDNYKSQMNQIHKRFEILVKVLTIKGQYVEVMPLAGNNDCVWVLSEKLRDA